MNRLAGIETLAYNLRNNILAKKTSASIKSKIVHTMSSDNGEAGQEYDKNTRQRSRSADKPCRRSDAPNSSSGAVTPARRVHWALVKPKAKSAASTLKARTTKLMSLIKANIRSPTQSSEEPRSKRTINRDVPFLERPLSDLSAQIIEFLLAEHPLPKPKQPKPPKPKRQIRRDLPFQERSLADIAAQAWEFMKAEHPLPPPKPKKPKKSIREKIKLKKKKKKGKPPILSSQPGLEVKKRQVQKRPNLPPTPEQEESPPTIPGASHRDSEDSEGGSLGANDDPSGVRSEINTSDDGDKSSGA